MGRLRNYFLNHYPRTDFHELNQDWMISMLFDMINQVENFVEMNSVKYADPIQWDITRQYEKNTIVIDEITGTAYISSKPVPKGVALSRTEYWNVIFDIGRFITLASQNFANSYEALVTTTATMPTDQDKWVVWNSILYRAKNDIHVGDMYVIDGNIEKYTVEMFFDELAHLIAEETEARIEADTALHGEIIDESVARENADNTLQDNIDAEENARITADNAIHSIIGNLSNLSTNVKDNIVNSINEVNLRVAGEITDRINAINAEHTAWTDAVNAEATARQNADANLLNKINTIFGSNVILVAKYGVQFNNISDAVNSIKNSVSSNNPYLILVASGTYNEHVDLSDINGLTIYGLGNVKIADTSTYPMSTVYVTGEVSLINLHLIQFGDSYCIHSDTQGTNNRVRLTVRDCILQRVQMGSGTYQHCIGWGSCDIGGDIYEIHNSHFIGGIGLGGHLNPFNTATGAVSWRVCNCTFEVATATIDWGDPCMMIYGTPTAQTIAAVFIGNQSNMGVIYRVNTNEVYNYIKAGTFCSLILSKGNNVPALNGIGPVTQWFVGSFSQSNDLGMAFVPFNNANLYDLEITYAIIQGNGTDIKTSCSVFTQSPNGFTIQISNYSAVGDYCVMVGTLATPKNTTAF